MTQEIHDSVAPCLEWGTPGHTCVCCGDAHHAIEQGANDIALALEAVGIPCVVEQTGGWVMIVRVYSDDKKRYLAINRPYGVGFVAEDDNGEVIDESFEMLGPCDGPSLDEIVETVRANLHRIGRA